MANPWYPNNGHNPPQQPAPGFPNQNPYAQGQPGGTPQQYAQYPMQPGRGPVAPHQFPMQQMYQPSGAPGHGPPGPPQQFPQMPYVPPANVVRGTTSGPNQPYQARAPFMTPHTQPPPQAPYAAARSTTTPSQTSHNPAHTTPPHAQPPPGSAGYAHHPQYDPRMQQYPGSHQPLYGSGSSIPPHPQYPGQSDMQMHGNREPPPFQMSYVTNEGLNMGAQDPRSLDAEARRAFDSADRDKSGYLDFKEFLDSLRALDLTIPYHYAMARFAKLDKDKDGRIRESEFVNGYLEDQFKQKQQHSLQSQQSQRGQSAQQQAPQYQHPQQRGYP